MAFRRLRINYKPPKRRNKKYLKKVEDTTTKQYERVSTCQSPWSQTLTILPTSRHVSSVTSPLVNSPHPWWPLRTPAAFSSHFPPQMRPALHPCAAAFCDAACSNATESPHRSIRWHRLRIRHPHKLARSSLVPGPESVAGVAPLLVAAWLWAVLWS